MLLIEAYVKFKRVNSIIFFQAKSLAQKQRPTKRAQMKGEVKGAKEIANKKTNQTKRSLARLLGGTPIIA